MNKKINVNYFIAKVGLLKSPSTLCHQWNINIKRQHFYNICVRQSNYRKHFVTALAFLKNSVKRLWKCYD